MTENLAQGSYHDERLRKGEGFGKGKERKFFFVCQHRGHKNCPEAMWSPTFEKPEWLPERTGRTRIAILERTPFLSFLYTSAISSVEKPVLAAASQMTRWDKHPFRRRIRSLGRYFICVCRDTIDWLLCQRHPLIPPTRLMFDAPLPKFFQDPQLKFKQDGEEYLRYLVEFAGLRPHHNVLDVGSGIGRISVALTGYLDKNGRYEGFDVVREGVDWCRKTISSRYPNFYFQWIDVFNQCYNPRGRYKACEYKFPFESGSFDNVIVSSVFTHMLPDDIENYISEIARVLKVGGCCLNTFFLLNKESLELLRDGKSALDFKHKMERYCTVDPLLSERAVAYNESFLIDVYQKYGLSINKPVYYGSWCGRHAFLSDQDIVVAVKN